MAESWLTTVASRVLEQLLGRVALESAWRSQNHWMCGLLPKLILARPQKVEKPSTGAMERTLANENSFVSILMRTSIKLNNLVDFIDGGFHMRLVTPIETVTSPDPMQATYSYISSRVRVCPRISSESVVIDVVPGIATGTHGRDFQSVGFTQNVETRHASSRLVSILL